jgi:flagellar motility protein MotE (MotC chaperone)
MLYLAEIQKKRAKMLGAVTAQLRLLAGQNDEQKWNVIPGEEIIEITNPVNNYAHGILVIVDIDVHRQIQTPLQVAGRHFVSILQNHARQLEKHNLEAAEIESWRQSLQLQTNQLLLRQEEIYNREDELEAAKREIERLTHKYQKLDATIQASEQQLQALTATWENLWRKQQLLAHQNIINSLTTQ